jgi:hypothetical protein
MSDATRDKSATEGVDYKFWSQISGWTISEAAALLLDIDPERIPPESSDREALGYKYRRLFRLLDRAREMEELDCPMIPKDFLTWASSNGIKPPGQLEATVRAGNHREPWRTMLLVILQHTLQSILLLTRKQIAACITELAIEAFWL